MSNALCHTNNNSNNNATINLYLRIIILDTTTCEKIF